MKYIKLYENYKNIEDICNKYRIVNYIINTDNTIDVNGYVNLSHNNLTEIPLQFGKVNGYFQCDHNKLESLKGSPYHVVGYFSCSSSKLNSLEYCSKYIGTSLGFSGSNIFSLYGINIVKGQIYYFFTPIEELINLFNFDIKLYMEYIDIYNFQRDDKIIKMRFIEALNDIGITELPKLNNYIYQ